MALTLQQKTIGAGRFAVLLSTVLLAPASCSSSHDYSAPGPVSGSYRLEWIPEWDLSVHLGAEGLATWDHDPVFVLRNDGTSPFLYTLECSEPWLQVAGVAAGVLPPQEVTVVRLGLAPAELPEDAHRLTARLRVLNSVTSYREVEVEVVLEVGATSGLPASPPGASDSEPGDEGERKETTGIAAGTPGPDAADPAQDPVFQGAPALRFRLSLPRTPGSCT